MHKGVSYPRKCFYRARAHSNPLNDASFPVPAHPDKVDWQAHYPEVYESRKSEGQSAPPVEFADVGCGFGGLLVRLSPLYPDKLMLGMELRDKVCEYVKERCLALRRDHVATGGFTNISCVRTNSMKYLLHYFRKGQLTKLFFLFPDPHFKASNHRRRIINDSLLDEYAYCLAQGGLLYSVTDVEELGAWMREKLDAHPLFERLSDEELECDPAAGVLTEATEEGQKVARNKGQTWRAVYRRLPNEVLESKD